MRAFAHSSCLILAAGLCLVACEDVRPGQAANSLERDAARQLVDQFSTLAGQPTEPDDILESTRFGPILTLLAPRGTPVVMPDGGLGDEQSAEDCLLSSGGAITYRECEFADHLVDGTWSAQAGRVHAELVDVFVVGPGRHGSFAVEASLVAGSGLSGSLDTALMWALGDGADYTLDALIRADGLVLDGAGCATGGTISLAGRFGDGADTAITLWFGPGCGDVQISR